MPSNASNDYLAAALASRCDQVKLADALRTLIGLYYQPNETEEERVRQIALFIGDLSDMSDDNVWWAMREWRRTQDRRPSPAALRQLCMARRHDLDREEKSRRPRDVGPQMWSPATPEQIAKRKSIMDRVAAQAGFVRDKEGALAWPSRPDDKPTRLPHWSETAAPDDPRWSALRAARAGARA